MKKFFFIYLIFSLSFLLASQSVIIETVGTASMGDTKSRKETIDEAKNNAKRTAIENASTFISAETTIKDFVTEKDLIEAFSQALVKVIEEVKGEWYKDELMGESYKITLKVEVTPKEISSVPKNKKMIDSPNAPLTVNIWTNQNKTCYKSGEKINLFLKGNKPFFARVVYLQNDGTQVQILPNPFRKENYFYGGTVYSLPSGEDTYDLTVEAPFGKEKIMVYASTAELGEIKVENAGPVFVIEDKLEDAGIKTRGIKINKKKNNNNYAAEFVETEIEITTEK